MRKGKQKLMAETAQLVGNTDEPQTEWSVSDVIFPPPSSSASYAVERFDYSQATTKDKAEIEELYRSYFAFLGLVFNPSLDTDFVDPLSYYHHAVSASDGTAALSLSSSTAYKAANGAYFVVRRYDCDDSSFIVGTLGVRLYPFPSRELLESFVDGVSDANTKEFLIGQMAPTTSAGASSRSLPPLRVGGSNTCELKRMILHPECRGKGFGKQLLRAALQWAFDQPPELSDDEANKSGLAVGGGYTLCVLDTKRWLRAANALYEAHGFVDCGNYNGNYRADRFLVAASQL